MMWQPILLAILFSTFLLNGASATPSNADKLKLWLQYPTDGTIDFYFFNWTNPQDLKKHLTRPNFLQIGPYRYNQNLEKSNLVYNDNGTLSFRQVIFWEYISGAIDDEVTILNPTALFVAHAARKKSMFVRLGVNMVINSSGETLAVTKSVRELLFDGYSDQLLTWAVKLNPLQNSEGPVIDKFGIFYKRNGSSDFSALLNIGIGNGTTFGKLYQVNGKDQSPDASGGEYFEPPLNKTNIKVYIPDLCTKFVLEYIQDEIVHGIVGYKYIMGNTTLNAEDRCLDNQEENCPPSGVLDISKCAQGAPFYISLPHFNKADPYYNEQISGLTPDVSNDVSSITIEPKTGFPLKFESKLQINMIVQKIRNIRMFEKVPQRYFFPLIYSVYKTEISADMAETIKSLIEQTK